MKKVYILLAALFFVAASCTPEKESAGTPGQQPAYDSTALHLALMPTTDCLPFYYAAQTGIYDSLHLNLQIHTYMSQMDCDTAFCNKHVQVCYTDLIRASLLQSKDTALYVVMQTEGRHHLITAFSKRIRAPRQMKEKMVAIARHSLTDYLSDLLVEKGEFKDEELYRPQINDISLREEMVANATLDAAFLPEPYATKALVKKHRSLFHTGQENIHLTALMAQASSATDARRSEQIKALVTGYNKAAALLRDKSHMQQAKTLLLPYNLTQQVLDSLRLPVYKPACLPKEEQVKKAVEWLKKRDLVPENYTGDTLLSHTFIKKT